MQKLKATSLMTMTHSLRSDVVIQTDMDRKINLHPAWKLYANTFTVHRCRISHRLSATIYNRQHLSENRGSYHGPFSM